MQNFLFHTPTEFAILALLLIAGWFLGLASAPGNRRWREHYHDESLAYANYRDRTESELQDAHRRIRDLETENARLAKAPSPAPAEAATGWLGWGHDNLTRIKGIDAEREARISETGIRTYRGIEKMTADDEAALEQRLGLDNGTIGREEWREQAALLRAGNEEELARRFG